MMPLLVLPCEFVEGHRSISSAFGWQMIYRCEYSWVADISFWASFSTIVRLFFLGVKMIFMGTSCVFSFVANRFCRGHCSLDLVRWDGSCSAETEAQAPCEFSPICIPKFSSEGSDSCGSGLCLSSFTAFMR